MKRYESAEMLYAYFMINPETELSTVQETRSSQEALETARASLPDGSLLEAMADLYKIMGDPTRLRLLLSLEKSDFCASDLADLCSMSRSAVSHQLKALKSAKLVRSTRSGKSMIYSLDDDHVHDILKVAFAHILENDPQENGD